MPNRTVPPLTNWNLYQAKEVIWDALHMAREDILPPDSNGPNDDYWENVCTAMAWLQEAAGCEEIMDEDEEEDDEYRKYQLDWMESNTKD